MSLSALSTAWNGSAPVLYLRTLPDRIRERSFWLVQVGMVAVALIHLGLEAFAAFDGRLAENLHHVPIILYLGPILYASLRYGFEGGLSTGVVAGIVSVPNIAIWHRDGFRWLGELGYLAVVVGVGLIVSLPVERERREWRRAERTSRRLRLVNQVATTLSRSPDIEEALQSALALTRDTMGLDTALLLEEGAGAGAHEGQMDVTIEVEGRSLGVLRVGRENEGPLSAEDLELVEAIAAQIKVAVENDRLRRLEHDRLKTYAQRVTEAQEEERTRIARDLHDDVAQSLIVLCRKLEQLELACPGEVPPGLGAARTHAQAVLATVRRFGRDLRPQILDDLGLVPALEWLASDISTRTGVHTDLKVEGLVRPLPPTTGVALFRVTQEALKNVEWHSEARTVCVLVRFEPTWVRVVVEDDGRGFDTGSLDSPGLEGGWGLLGMEERMKLVGGRLDVRSRRGSGTVVTAEVDQATTDPRP